MFCYINYDYSTRVIAMYLTNTLSPLSDVEPQTISLFVSDKCHLSLLRFKHSPRANSINTMTTVVIDLDRISTAHNCLGTFNCPSTGSTLFNIIFGASKHCYSFSWETLENPDFNHLSASVSYLMHFNYHQMQSWDFINAINLSICATINWSSSIFRSKGFHQDCLWWLQP